MPDEEQRHQAWSRPAFVDVSTEAGQLQSV